MKILNAILLLIIGFSVIAAQEKEQREIKNYIALMNEFVDSSTMTLKKPIQISDDQELKRISKTLYESYADPIAKIHETENSVNKISSIAQGDQMLYRKLSSQKYGAVEVQLLRLIKQKFSELDYNIIITQSILKGKVLSQKEIPNRFSDNPNIVGGSQKIYLKVLVEDIVKGDNLLKVGDIINVTYNAYFTHAHRWNVGESFLFNLRFWLKEGVPYRTINYLGQDDGCFPIENNILIDKTNYFKQGENVDWNMFKTNVKSRIKNLLY